LASITDGDAARGAHAESSPTRLVFRFRLWARRPAAACEHGCGAWRAAAGSRPPT